MSTGDDVEVGPSTSLDRLRSLALESAEPTVATAAVHALSARRSPQRSEALVQALADRTRPTQVRAAAALALGRDDRPEHQTALMDALAVRDRDIARRVVESLGRIGDVEAYERLNRVRRSDPVAARAVSFARTLLSYRHGLGVDLIDAPPPEHLPEDQYVGVGDVEVSTTPSSNLLEEALDDAHTELPAVRLSPDAAVGIECGESSFVAAFTDEVQRRQTLTPLGQRNAVLAVVLRRVPPLAGFEPWLWVLTHPERADRLRLFGVRTTGQVVLTGEANLDERAALFRMGSLRTPTQTPVTVEAQYDHESKEVSFVRALIASDFAPEQKQATAPQRTSRPVRRTAP